jgi:hypothetical protein
MEYLLTPGRFSLEINIDIDLSPQKLDIPVAVSIFPAELFAR